MAILKREGVPHLPLWQPQRSPFILLHRMYDWVLSWADSPYGTVALFVLAFSESSFFPIPPDVLIIALAIGVPRRAFFFALIASLGSVLGGAFGYFIGWKLMDIIGFPIINFYGIQDKYEYIRQVYQQYDAWFVFIAGFTPIPYKLFTIAGGACQINFLIFLLASLVGRSLRFFMVGTLIYFFGAPVKKLIDRYFNLFTIIFALLLIGGFFVIKWVMK